MILYRPVGAEELRLVFATGMKTFPPRRPDQPIFYPVLQESYARQIARDSSTKAGTLAGYVTRFTIRDEYVKSLSMAPVRAVEHQELWISAENLAQFCAQIEGRIEVLDAYFGDGFEGLRAEQRGLRGMSAVEQLLGLEGTFAHDATEFHAELAANRDLVFLHFPFWLSRSFVSEGLNETRRAVVLQAIRTAWRVLSPEVPLLDPPLGGVGLR